MRVIKDIIVHCSGTKATTDIGVAEIKRYHTQKPPYGKGWKDIGYHYVVRLDGTVERGRAISRAGAHCYGHNAHSIGVCYVGGLDASGTAADTRTPAQKSALLKLIYNLVQMYRCDVHGHHDYNKGKDCPCFDAHAEYTGLYRKTIGIDETKET